MTSFIDSFEEKQHEMLDHQHVLRENIVALLRQLAANKSHQTNLPSVEDADHIRV